MQTNQVTGDYYARQFGFLKFDGQTDDGKGLLVALQEIALAGGGRLILPPAVTVGIKTLVTIPSNCGLVIPTSTTLKALAAIAAILENYDPTNGNSALEISGGGVLDANGLATYCVNLTKVTLARLSGFQAKNALQHGIYLLSSSDNHMDSLDVRDNSQSSAGTYFGFAFDGTSSGNTTANCRATDDQGTPTQGYGWGEVAGMGGDHNTFAACNFEGNRTGTAVTVGANSGSTTTGTFSGAALVGPTIQEPNLAITAINSAHVVATSDTFLVADTTGGSFTVTLPAASGSGRVLTVFKKSSDANQVSILANGGDTMDGLSLLSLPATQYGGVLLVDAAAGLWERRPIGAFAVDVATAQTISGPKTLISPILTGAGGTTAGEAGINASEILTLGDGTLNRALGSYKLGEVVVGAGGQASITFTSIPQGYRHLRLEVVARSLVNSGIDDWIVMQFNGDGAADYQFIETAVNVSTVAGSTTTGGTGLKIAQAPGATFAPASAAGVAVVDIPFYSLASWYHNFVSQGTDGSQWSFKFVGQWNQAAAITSITLTLGTASNFAQNSIATLYGVP